MRDEQTPKDVSSSFSVAKNLCDLPAITNPFSDFPNWTNWLDSFFWNGLKKVGLSGYVHTGWDEFSISWKI